MSLFTARWIVPIAGPPLPGGWVRVASGQVVAVGGRPAPRGATDLGDLAILPGLVNAHTHLELGWMAGRVPAASSMAEWISTLVRLRRAGVSGGPSAEREAARLGAIQARESGTALVGDISNTLITPAILAETGLGGVVFHELLGFNAADPEGLVKEAWARVDREAASHRARQNPWPLALTPVAHAPYSVSVPLFREIRARARSVPLAIHLAESRDEIEFLRTGQGPLRGMLEAIGAWNPDWTVPATDPVQYVSDLGYLRPGTLAVHAVHATDAALGRLCASGAVLVTCPRSNEWVGAGPPPLARFYASGVPVAIGTDSLASSPSLNLFDELATMRRLAPEVPPTALLQSATRVGAEALGYGDRFGTIEPGKLAALIGVGVPAGVTDVEEYLVGGVPLGAIQWVARPESEVE